MFVFFTSYFPPISYIALMAGVKYPVIDIHENYIKQTYRNRCIIAGANGLQRLSIPVSKSSNTKTLTKDVLIDYSINWQKNHQRTIESAYNNSPFFLYYRDELESCLNCKEKYLIDMNNKILYILFKQLLKDSKIIISDKYTDMIRENDYFYNVINSKRNTKESFPSYRQVFCNKYGFISDLSIIDLLFNLGPDSSDYLKKLTMGIQF